MFGILGVRARQVANRLIVKSYSEHLDAPERGRALLSYLPLHVMKPRRWRNRVQFSNAGIAQAVPRALNELGYVVDIVDYRHPRPRLSGPYDLFVGHGGHNFQSLSRFVHESAARIYFATGLYWREQNRRAAKRLHEVAIRYGHLIRAERVCPATEEIAFGLADGVVSIGDGDVRTSFGNSKPVYCVDNAVFPLQGHIEKDYAVGKRDFLFFAGRGSVHKGLDLLIDAFRVRSDLRLHVCQHIEADFARAFSSQIGENVHLHGFVKARSARFLSIAAGCNWVILPTCAEGQPGSVLEAQLFGLIPVVTREANLRDANGGVSIDDLTPDGVLRAISYAAEMSVSQCRSAADRGAQCLTTRHTEEAFRASFKAAIMKLEAVCR